MIADNITDYYLEHSQPTQIASNTAPLSLPIIKSWRCIEVSNQVIIRGQVYNHPKYSAGKQLKSSPIQGCLTKAGHVYVTTKNSMYELGTPHPNVMSDAQLGMDHSGCEQWAKLTSWGQ